MNAKRLVLASFMLSVVVVGSPAQKEDEFVCKVKSLIDQLKGNNVNLRAPAARELMGLGPAARTAVPLMIEELAKTEGENRQIITNALAKVGAPAVPGLAMALKNKDAGVRRQAGIALSKIGVEAKEALPALAEAIADPDREIRSFALAAIIQIDSDPKTLLPVLTRALKDADKSVRITTLFALEGIAAKVDGVVPILATGLDDKEKDVRISTAAVLSRLGDKARPAVPALSKALKDTEGEVRVSAALTLVRVDPTQKQDVLPALFASLADKDPAVRRAAAYVLGEVGDQAAVAGLTRASKDDDNGNVRQAAEQALAKIRK